MTAIFRIIVVVFTCCWAYAQSVDKALTFEVASIKPSVPMTPVNGRIVFRGPTGGPGTKDPGRINYPNMSLKNLLMNAYDVKTFQIAGPAWLDTERFDITATMPPDTTKEQFRTMLQNLLIERFRMAMHKETRDLPMYSLVVGKNGPKMKEAAEVAAPAAAEEPRLPPTQMPPRPTLGPDGFPILPSMGGRPGIMSIMMPGRARMTAQQQTMQDLANRLTMQLNRPVIDATGLTAKYDFTLTYSPEGTNGPMGPMGPMGVMVPPPPPPPGGGGGLPGANPGSTLPETETPPDIHGAVQTQLGLKLEAKKGPVEVIVIDRMEKTPTEN